MQVHSYVMNELNREYLLLEREVYDEALFLFIGQKGDDKGVTTLLNDLLAELEVEERQLVEYAYLYSYKAREIARALGVAEETMKNESTV